MKIDIRILQKTLRPYVLRSFTEIEDNPESTPSCQWEIKAGGAAVRSRDCGRIGNFSAII